MFRFVIVFVLVIVAWITSDDEMSFASPSASQSIVIKDTVMTIVQLSVHRALCKLYCYILVR